MATAPRLRATFAQHPGRADTSVNDTTEHPARGTRSPLLVLGALGVVFGDIGTSPLYAFRETFESQNIAVDESNVIGVCSLILWSMVLVVSIKYVVFILRADNHGEGGILALTTQVVDKLAGKANVAVLLVMGLFGVALLYGDGLITPAISVLAATEGLEVASPSLGPWVLPIAVGILLALFSIQRRGTASIGSLFGPIMLIWFTTLAVLGITRMADNPDVFESINPVHAVEYLADNGFKGFLSLGSVFLVVTGGEALYADLGHFGRTPIVNAWFAVAFPGLALNYLGQGALLLEESEAIENPFFLMGPEWARWPLVALATCATVIASQALITGAFSMTVQAIQLDYLPRLRVRHTSAEHRGQVYVPLVNWLLAAGAIGLVLAFRSSGSLAAAYGIAVTATMALTTILFASFARNTWGWSSLRIAAICIPFGILDLAFFGANVFKIPDGGWFPLVVAAILIVSMTTWRTGRQVVADRLARREISIEEFVRSLPEDTRRVRGTAVYMFRGDGAAPPALVSNTRHNRVLHDRVILLRIEIGSEPTVPADQRASVTFIRRNIHQLVLRFGFMEEPNVTEAMAGLDIVGKPIDIDDVTFFLGREIAIPSDVHAMPEWRERYFAFMLRSAASASRFFHLPSDRIVEIGSQVQI